MNLRPDRDDRRRLIAGERGCRGDRRLDGAHDDLDTRGAIRCRARRRPVAVVGDGPSARRMVRRADDRVLELDRSARRGDRGHEQGGQVVHAERSAAGGRGAAAPQKGEAATSGGATPSAAGEPQLGQDPERPDDRADRGQLTAHPAQLTPEALAANAVTHVLARGCVGADSAVVRLDELLPDQQAGGVTRLSGLGQRHPGANQQ